MYQDTGSGSVEAATVSMDDTPSIGRLGASANVAQSLVPRCWVPWHQVLSGQHEL